MLLRLIRRAVNAVHMHSSGCQWHVAAKGFLPFCRSSDCTWPDGYGPLNLTAYLLKTCPGRLCSKEAVLELRIRSAIDLRKAGRRASRRAKRGDDPQYSAPERDSDSAKSLTDKARRWRSMASSSASEKQVSWSGTH